MRSSSPLWHGHSTEHPSHPSSIGNTTFFCFCKAVSFHLSQVASLKRKSTLPVALLSNSARSSSLDHLRFPAIMYRSLFPSCIFVQFQQQSNDFSAECDAWGTPASIQSTLFPLKTRLLLWLRSMFCRAALSHSKKKKISPSFTSCFSVCAYCDSHSILKELHFFFTLAWWVDVPMPVRFTIMRGYSTAPLAIR